MFGPCETITIKETRCSYCTLEYVFISNMPCWRQGPLYSSCFWHFWKLKSKTSVQVKFYSRGCPNMTARHGTCVICFLSAQQPSTLMEPTNLEAWPRGGLISLSPAPCKNVVRLLQDRQAFESVPSYKTPNINNVLDFATHHCSYSCVSLAGRAQTRPGLVISLP